MRVKSFDIDGYFERVYEELEQLCQLYGDYGLIDTYILPFLSRSMNDIKKTQTRICIWLGQMNQIEDMDIKHLQ